MNISYMYQKSLIVHHSPLSVINCAKKSLSKQSKKSYHLATFARARKIPREEVIFMTEEYQTVMHRWFEEVWNNQREEVIDELMHPECVAYGLNDSEGNPLRGPEGFKQLYKAFIQAYPDIHITVEETVIEGERMVARCTVRGTHTGEGIGVAPTKRSIEFTGLVMVKFQDGKFIEGWNQFDFMNMYQQLGVLSLTIG